MTKKDEIRFTAGDIPSILKKGFKPMTDSNIQPPQNTLESDFVDIKDPVPGTEVTQTPGLEDLCTRMVRQEMEQEQIRHEIRQGLRPAPSHTDWGVWDISDRH